jgi:hypothetical protein
MISSLPPLSMATSSYRYIWAGCRRKEKTALPANFCPGQYSVLCGYGKICLDLTKNNYLKVLVKVCIDPYSTAKTKIEKSSIVSAIVERIKELVAPEDSATFVKFEDG